jgi:hypothetical protein
VGGSIGGVGLTCIKEVGQEREFGLKSREQDRKKVMSEKGKERHLLLLEVAGKKRWSSGSVGQDRKLSGVRVGEWDRTGQDKTGKVGTGQVRSGQDVLYGTTWSGISHMHSTQSHHTIEYR